MSEGEQAPEAPPAPPENDPETEALRERIREAFDLFDKEGRGTVVQEEVSTIMRYLGAFPSEKDMVERVLPDIQEDEPTAFVTYEKFERKMLDVLRNSEYSPDSSDMMLQAFRVLDTEKKGYITAERMEELLSTKGTPFREKEMENFLSVAKDLETGRIYYEDYVALLTEDA